MFEAVNLLPDMVEAMLPTFSGKLALKMTLRVELGYFGDKVPGDDLHQRQCVQMLFHRPSNYTKVYSRVSQVGGKPEYPDTWTKTSDHDSCWRWGGISLFRKAYFDLRGPFKLAHLEWHEVSEFVSFDLFSGKPHYVTVEDARSVDQPNTIFPRLYRLEIGDQVPLHKIHHYLRVR